MNDTKEPLLSIIVINFGEEEHLHKLISSLEKSTFKDFELLLGDVILSNSNNTKIKGTVAEKLISSNINFKLVRLENYGAPGNRNVLASYAKGEYLLFLDNDTEILEDTLTNVMDFIKKENSNLVVQLKLVYPNGLIDSCGGLISDLGYPVELNRNSKANEKCFEIKEIFYAKGAAMLVNRRIFKELGGFDKDYFYGYADTDFSFRALKRGYKVVFFPATVIHHEHGSFSKDLRSREIRLTYFLESRRLYFLLKNFSRGYLFRKMPKVLFYFFGSMLMDLVKRRKTYLFKARVKALLWVISKLPEIYRKRKNEIFINEEELIRRGLIVKHQLKR
ncbi:MAG: glycosyltransferase family 2 protein [Sulfolobus sp.]